MLVTISTLNYSDLTSRRLKLLPTFVPTPASRNTSCRQWEVSTQQVNGWRRFILSSIVPRRLQNYCYDSNTLLWPPENCVHYTICTPHPFVSYIIERTRISYYSTIQNSIKCLHIEFDWGKSILSLRSEMKWISMVRWTENRCQGKLALMFSLFLFFVHKWAQPKARSSNRKSNSRSTVSICFTVMQFFTQNKWSRLARSILWPIYSHRSGFFASYLFMLVFMASDFLPFFTYLSLLSIFSICFVFPGNFARDCLLRYSLNLKILKCQPTYECISYHVCVELRL